MLNRRTSLTSKFFGLAIVAIASIHPSHATDVFVDFGVPDIASPTGWNDARALYLEGSISLETTSNAWTGYTLTTTERFTSHQPYGTLAPTNGIPLNAARDGMYGNETEYQGYFAPNAEMKFTGLNPSVSYTFSIFASVDKDDSLDRTTSYDLIGGTSYTKWLNPTNNTGTSVVMSVYPTSAGVITLIVRRGPGNNTADKFYHIGHVKMSYTLPGGNTSPVVSAAASPSTITLPVSEVSLTSSATDDGTIVSYKWTKVSGGNAVFDNSNDDDTIVRSLVAGNYVFQVRVTDDDGAFTDKTVAVTVNSSGTVSAPIFNLVNVGTNGAPYGYTVYLPRGYTQAAAASYPFMIFMHGIGERGGGIRDPLGSASYPITATSTQIGRTGTYTTNHKYTNSLLTFGPNAYIRANDLDLPFVIFSIQHNPSGPFDWVPSLVDDFVDYAIARYKVNPARLHMTGMSFGGGGSLHYSYLYPSKVASLTTVCPGYYNQSLSTAVGPLVDNNVAVWASVAYNDHLAPFQSRPRKLMNHMASEIGGTSTDVIHYLTTVPGRLTGIDPENLNMANYMTDIATTHTAHYDRVGRKWTWKTGQDPVQPSGWYPVTFTFYTNYPVVLDDGLDTYDDSHQISSRIYNDYRLYNWMQSKYR